MIEKLRLYNQWRRGADIPQPDPTEIGELLDTVADRLEVLEREAAEHYERWHQERRRREFLELRLEAMTTASREIMAESGARELPEGEPERMKIKAFQVNDKIRVIATGQIGRIYKTGMVDGIVKYFIVGHDPDGFSGWFSGWEIERV